MLFNSVHFLFFLPIIFGSYYLLPHKFRWVLLFLASCYFYKAFVPRYILILFAIILIDYVSGIAIERAQTKASKRLFLVLSILSNVGILCFFKYFNFLNENLGDFAAAFGGHFKPYHLNVILPIGLSFHTFQSMSYTIEVYRGTQKAEKHLGYFANYVLFFPQMVAGPIETYASLGSELKTERKLSYENISHGLRLILFGFFVKMVVADNLAPLVNEVYKDPSAYSPTSVLLAVIFFSFQIYADFYGYSVIAMGSARLLGIKLMDNFNTPYLATSVNEFWKRWHISLTTWFREYVFIPLGGSRVGHARWILNILIIFFVSGLWHGASWTFVVWGLLHGIVYLLERGFSKLFSFKIKQEFSLLNLLLGIKTFFVVSFIWIFFRAESFNKAKQVIKALMGNGEKSLLHTSVYYALFLIVVLLLFDASSRNRIDLWLGHKKASLRWALYGVLVFFILALSGIENLPFIYFQF
jgi:alginate O-acetyltransferase complex protein AlgI